jgi:brefeldin A-inhibited guanine nucleotide-exchange protein
VKGQSVEKKHLAVVSSLEYSDEENVMTMHTFVDLLDFTGLAFTDALRNFLQCFRLPGESQKIDRFMLKFAERYMACNTETDFKNGGR